MALKIGQRIGIYKIVANVENFDSPCMKVMGNFRPGIKGRPGVFICCVITEELKKWRCDYYMHPKEVKLVGCMVIKSIK